MTAAHELNYHHPVNHNKRLAKLIRRKERLLNAAKAEHLWLCDLEKDGIKLNREDSDKCSRLFFEIRELAADIIELEDLILPEEN
jgi:hypothetical protein